MKLAVTGGTGFVGRRLLKAAVGQGHEVRALTRRPQQPLADVEWIEGSLENRDSLEKLVEATDALIHVAGVISAQDAAAFEKGNVAGTLAILAAATAAGTCRFVHVSSLAAREPEISRYGASKARSEELVRRSGLDWVIVRPPAVYGPGDRETLELFRMARTGVVLLPPKGRLSLLHADDLSALLLAMVRPHTPSRLLIEPDDGRAGGWDHREFGKALGRAVGRRTICLSTPRSVLRAGAAFDGLLRRGKAKLTPDRAAYFCHPDWVADPTRSAPKDLWRPRIDTDEGLAATAAWYREQGWL